MTGPLNLILFGVLLIAAGVLVWWMDRDARRMNPPRRAKDQS